ncbi:MAG: hypothetical protein QGI80_03000, partial [archaeon]|nr:hypothetical protein [archaeon]
KYRRPFLGKYIFIVTSRGCPFPCIFCRQIVMFKGIFRQKSPERVVEEIKEAEEAPKGVPPVQMTSADADKGGKDGE